MTQTVKSISMFDLDKCTGCGICEKVCPTSAIELKEADRFPEVDATGSFLVYRDHKKCFACGACEQRCPFDAIDIVDRDVNPQASDKYYAFEDEGEIQEEVVFGTDVSDVDYSEVWEICKEANFLPKQIVCYCTQTRAEEAAAAILKGAETMGELSLMTGMTSGCKVECIQPKLRLLKAAGIEPEPPEDKWTWTRRTSTIWDIPEDVKERFSEKGFKFDEDIALLNEALSEEEGGD